MKTEIVPEKYSIVISRVRFELGRSISCAAFMLNKHIDDKDDTFLKSDICIKLLNECAERLINKWVVEDAILNQLGFNSNKSEILTIGDYDEYYASGELK